MHKTTLFQTLNTWRQRMTVSLPAAVRYRPKFKTVGDIIFTTKDEVKAMQNCKQCPHVFRSNFTLRFSKTIHLNLKIFLHLHIVHSTNESNKLYIKQVWVKSCTVEWKLHCTKSLAQVCPNKEFQLYVPFSSSKLSQVVMKSLAWIYDIWFWAEVKVNVKTTLQKTIVQTVLVWISLKIPC